MQDKSYYLIEEIVFQRQMPGREYSTCAHFKFHLYHRINLCKFVIRISLMIINQTGGGLYIVSLLCVSVSEGRSCNHGSGL